MLYPSIDKLLERINSKYSLVTVSARRARELQNADAEIDEEKYKSHTHVGRALEEIEAGLLKIKMNDNNDVK